MTGVLEVAIRHMKIYDPVISVMIRLLGHSKEVKVIDLCSGSGGGILRLHPMLETNWQNPVYFVLTDLYPNLPKAEALEKSKSGRISYRKEGLSATDAIQIPADLYTIFAGYHHFNDDEKRMLVNNLVESKKPLLIVEGAERSVLSFIAALLLLPFLTLLAVPFIRPFRFQYFLFTYLLPLIPFLVWWDGLISLMSIEPVEKSRLDLASMAPSYSWTSGTFRRLLFMKTSWVAGQLRPTVAESFS